LETAPSECHDGGLLLAKVGEGLPSTLSKGFGEEERFEVGGLRLEN
jgi:hypothetical protein